MANSENDKGTPLRFDLIEDAVAPHSEFPFASKFLLQRLTPISTSLYLVPFMRDYGRRQKDRTARLTAMAAKEERTITSIQRGKTGPPTKILRRASTP